VALPLFRIFSRKNNLLPEPRDPASVGKPAFPGLRQFHRTEPVAGRYHFSIFPDLLLNLILPFQKFASFVLPVQFFRSADSFYQSRVQNLV
jgi:hypothetical protein